MMMNLVRFAECAIIVVCTYVLYQEHPCTPVGVLFTYSTLVTIFSIMSVDEYHWGRAKYYMLTSVFIGIVLQTLLPK